MAIKGENGRKERIYGERLDRTRTNKRKKKDWLLPTLIIIAIVGAIGLAGYKAYDLIKDKEAEAEAIKEEMRDLEIENKLLEMALAEKTQYINDIKEGKIDGDGNKGKRVYLTFDDGPNEVVNDVIKILATYNVQATFFVNGDDSDDAMDVYNNIIDNGHLLANHLYSHDYQLVYESKDAFMQSLHELEELVQNRCGVKMDKVLRFPGGSQAGTPEVMQQIKIALAQEGYRYFDWNVEGGDASRKKPTTQEIVKKVMQYTDGKSTAVILLHTTSVYKNNKPMLKALPDIIEYLKGQGYEFHLLNEADAPTGIVFGE